MHRSRGQEDDDMFEMSYGADEIERQRAILAQIERERFSSSSSSSSAAVSSSSSSAAAAAASSALAPSRSPCARPLTPRIAPYRVRSRSNEMNCCPGESSVFAAMIQTEAKTAELSSPGVVRVRDADGDGSCGGGGGVPSFPSIDSHRRSHRWNLRPSDLSSSLSSGATLESDIFDVGCIEERLAALDRAERNQGAEDGRNVESVTMHRRMSLSLPASEFGGGGGGGGDGSNVGVRYDEGITAERGGILEGTGRHLQQQQQHHHNPMHRQIKSFPYSRFGEEHDQSVRFDEDAIEEQRSILRDIEKRRQRQELQYSIDNQSPWHPLSESFPSDVDFIDRTSFEEQRAILDKIQRDRRSRVFTTPTLPHRPTKSLPSSSTSFRRKWWRAASDSEVPMKIRCGDDNVDVDDERFVLPPRCSSDSAAVDFVAERRKWNFCGLYDRTERKTSHNLGLSLGGGVSARMTAALGEEEERKDGGVDNSHSPPEEMSAGGAAAAAVASSTAATAAAETHSPYSFSSFPLQRSSAAAAAAAAAENVPPIRTFSRASAFANPTEERARGGGVTTTTTTTTAAEADATAAASAAAAAAAIRSHSVRAAGRHTVLLVDGRDAVARGGGLKKRVTCAGCDRHLTVSRECEVVFCPACETLTPAALSEEVGAWGQSR